ncbi:MAG TPA: ELWxxDGT repeat protein [Thermoanaerobaculia bacterium]|nr:ELWxxDGT repeat protein [Thermoanaerobaculia bacterium]
MNHSGAFRNATAAALLSLAAVAHAATPAALVRDVRRTPGPNLSSAPSYLVSLGDRALFWASAPLVGRELFRTDGTTAGTFLVTDLCPGSCDSLSFAEHPPIVAAGYAFFLATDGARGTELWRSDGTAAGTRPMIDLAAGPEDGFYLFLIAGGDRALFATLPPFGEGIDLWQSDGTAAGTAPFVHLADGAATALTRPVGAAALGPLPGGQRLYFPNFLVGGDSGVWESDGTAAGTRPVRALPEASRVFCSERSDLPRVAAGGLVVSLSGAGDGTDCEPWLAAEGVARPISDLAPGPEGSFPYGFIRIGPVTLFAATVPGLGEELWRTDGTAAGTFLLGDANPGDESAHPVFLGDLGGEAYYSECDAAAGCELWATDGAAGSLRRVADLTPGPESSDLMAVGVAGGRLWFKAFNTVGGSKLWTIDAAGTLDSIATLGAGGDFRTPFASVGPLAVFGADLGEGLGTELAVSDGTSAGTQTLRDLLGRDASSFPDQLTPAAGRVLFTATDDTHGNEVWRTDGTGAGTGLVADLTPAGAPYDGASFLAPTATGVALQAPDGSIRHARARAGGIDFLFRPDGEFPGAGFGFRRGGKAHFIVSAGDFPQSTLELWQVDGRPTGSRELAEIARFRPVVGYQVTVAADPAGGRAFLLPVNTDGKVGDIFDGLWITDGTLAGTRRAVPEPCAPCSEVRAGDAIVGPGGQFFYVIVDIVGRFAQLWVSDGTPAGTKKLHEGPGPLDGGEIRSLARLGSRVIFSAFDFARGQELWVSDGTAGGTRPLSDLRPGPLSSSPAQLVSVGGRVYFSADDGKTGRELWATDGTPAGTKRVADLRPGARASVPQALTAIGNRLVFAADDGKHGLEVWSSDGTAAGTRLASDVQVGRLPSTPSDFVLLGSNLLFVASRLGTGRELFRLPLAALGAP